MLIRNYEVQEFCEELLMRTQSGELGTLKSNLLVTTGNFV